MRLWQVPLTERTGVGRHQIGGGWAGLYRRLLGKTCGCGKCHQLHGYVLGDTEQAAVGPDMQPACSAIALLDHTAAK
jgi:hypothetical protein